MRAVLALDLGGTVLKAAVVDEHGTAHGYRTSASREQDGVEGWLAAVLAIARDVRDEAGPTPSAVGVSVPGAVDPTSGRLLDLVARLDVGEGLDLPAALAGLGLPVHADNDARAALAAERRWGAARGVDDVVLLTLGTGLGGAAVVDGLLPGRHPLAGNQIGHFTVDLDGPPCVCGNRGCAETSASATGLLRLAAERGARLADAQQVLDAARGGDVACVEALERFTSALTAVVVTAVHAYQPSLVVLGGGLLGAADLFLPQVRAAVTERAWTTPRGAVRVVASELEHHLGVAGAAAVAFRGTTTHPHRETTSRRAS